MSKLYAAVAVLVIAQLVGIYGLKTRKADLVFGVVAALLLAAAVALAVAGANSLRGSSL